MHGRNGRRSVDPDLAPRLGVLQLGDAHVGQFGFARIEDADPHQVVFAAGDFQGVGELLAVACRIEEIREQERRAALLHHGRQETHRLRQRRARRPGPEADQLADNHQDVAAPLLGRDVLLHAVGEEDAAHLVVVLGGREGHDGGDFGQNVLFEEVGRPEHARGRDVDHEHHRQLALLLVDLDVGRARTRRDVPVDVAHVVAGTVLPHFGKRHAPSAESRVVLSGEDLVRQAACLDLDFADPSQNIVFVLDHRVTGRLRCSGCR